MPNELPVQSETPFLVEHHQRDRTLSGNFRPEARMVLLPSLRTSGLWAMLPPEDFKNLILMLTYLSPNGHCQPTAQDLAEAMQVSQAKARSRMLRLVQQEWRGKPLVMELPRPEGIDAYTPGRQLVADEQVVPLPPPAAPLWRAAGREAVIAHSRSRYARTRAEVEQDIAERMGWMPPVFEGEDPAVSEGKRQLYGQMTNLGVSREQALDLLGRFDLSHIERQLAWLPARHAKSPARFLVAAIEGDYEMPPALRRQAIMAKMAQPAEFGDWEDNEDAAAVSEPEHVVTAEAADTQDIAAQDGATIYEA